MNRMKSYQRAAEHAVEDIPDQGIRTALGLVSIAVGATELLAKVREDPTLLVADPKRDIRAFRIALSGPMGAKRGTGRGGFIDSVLDLVDTFYGDVVQNLKAWAAAPPRMRENVAVPDERPGLSSTALSSQDGTQTQGTNPEV